MLDSSKSKEVWKALQDPAPVHILAQCWLLPGVSSIAVLYFHLVSFYPSENSPIMISTGNSGSKSFIISYLLIFCKGSD